MTRSQVTWMPAVCLALLCTLIFPTPTFAKGKTRLPRTPRTPAGTGTAGRTDLPIDAQPAWLDDVDTLDPGTASLELSVNRWSTSDGGQTDGPVLDLAVGLTSQIQLSVSLPHYSARYTDGYSASGRGDSYLALKVQLLDPSDHRIGVSVEPLVEVLSDAAVSDPTLGLSRVNWGVPITFQIGSDDTKTRAYTTAGYFSRHAAFWGGAVEYDASSAVTVIGTAMFSTATKRNASSDLLGLSGSRTDATGMMYVSVTKTVSFFGALGRTISNRDQNGARLIASVGVRVETTRHPKP